MRKILGGLAALLLLVGASFGQGSIFNDIVLDNTGRPAANAQVKICSFTATGTPCSPAATIYSDRTLLTTKANPMTTDGYGNFSMYCEVGFYKAQITVNGATRTQVIGCGSMDAAQDGLYVLKNPTLSQTVTQPAGTSITLNGAGTIKGTDAAVCSVGPCPVANGDDLYLEGGAPDGGGLYGNVYFRNALKVSPRTDAAVDLGSSSFRFGQIFSTSLDISRTWNGAGTQRTPFTVDVTNTLSGASSRLEELKVGGASQYWVGKDGKATSLTDFCIFGGACLSTAGATTPASPDTSVQFNDGGAFGGSAAFTFDKALGRAHAGPAESTLDPYLQGWWTPNNSFLVTSSDSASTAAMAIEAQTGTTGNAQNALGITTLVRGEGMMGNAIDIVTASHGNINVALLKGIESQIFHEATGTATQMVAFQADTPQITGGAVAEAYGLLVQDQTGATANYAIKTGLGSVDIDDRAIFKGNVMIEPGNGSGSDVGSFFWNPDDYTTPTKGSFWCNAASSPYNCYVDETSHTYWTRGTSGCEGGRGCIDAYASSTAGTITTTEVGEGGGFFSTDSYSSCSYESNLFQCNTGKSPNGSSITASNTSDTATNVSGLTLTTNATNGKTATSLAISATSNTAVATGISVSAVSSGGAAEKGIAVNIQSGRLIVAPETPASSVANCTAGTIAVDATYIYVCTASNIWKRAALSAF